MVVLYCKTLPKLWEILLFIRKANEPVHVMAIRGKTFHNLLYQSSCVCL